MKVHLTVTDAMHADPAVQDFIARTGAKVTRAHDTYEDIHTSQGSLGAAPMIIIGAAVAVLLPGGGTMLQIMLKAGCAAMVPQFANGLVMHGNPLEALAELANPDNLRATFIAAATAGAMNHFNIAAPFGSTNVLDHATYAAQSMAVRMPLELAISRQDARDIIASSIRNALAATVAGTLTSHIGQGMHPASGEPPRLDWLTHKVLHALTGAGTAGIAGGDMLSGAFGAVVGEIAGEIYRSTGMANLTPGTDAWNRAAETGANVAQMIATTAAMALDLEADTAANAADTATRNNVFALGLAIPPAIEAAFVALQATGLVLIANDFFEAYNRGGMEAAYKVLENNIQLHLATGGTGRVWQAGLQSLTSLKSIYGSLRRGVPSVEGVLERINRSMGKRFAVTPGASTPKSANTNTRPAANTNAPAPTSRTGGASSSSGPHMENQVPYDPRAMESMLRSNNPGKGLISTTLPGKSLKNVKLAGKQHPVSGVYFDRRGYPIFDSHAIMDTRIPSSIASGAVSDAHKRAATLLLKEEINAGRILGVMFTPKQMKQIQAGRAQIDGFTWHHHQDFSRMQLIPRKIHDKTGHVGGDKMWGLRKKQPGEE